MDQKSLIKWLQGKLALILNMVPIQNFIRIAKKSIVNVSLFNGYLTVAGGLQLLELQ